MAEQVETLPQDIEETTVLEGFLASESLVADLSEDQITKLGQTCVLGYQMDVSSVSDRMEEMHKLNEIAQSKHEKKTYPWPDASNIKYPLILNAALQFNGRTYPAILNDGNIAKIAVTGNDEDGQKQKRADRIGKHMSYQLTEEMEAWEAGMDWLFISLPLVGCVFKKIWFDDGERRNASEVVSAVDLIVDNGTKDLKSCPRISHVVAFYPYEMTEYINMGLWRNAEINISDEETQKPEEFVEQHLLYDLDEDGYPEPYIVTFHKGSGEVVRIEPNFSAEDVEIDENDEVIRIIRTQYFVKYECFPDPQGGFYGVGLGQLLRPINDSVDSILNLMIDSGHLANTGGGFLAKGFRFKSGSVRISPGKWVKTDIPGGMLKDSIVPLPVPQPSAVLFSLLGLLIDSGKDIASIQDVLIGAGGKNMPATSVLALIEQGMKVYTAIFKRIYRSLKEELKLLYELNQVYLTDEEYQNILDEEASVTDYEGLSKDVQPEADPNMVTDMQQQFRARAIIEVVGPTPKAQINFLKTMGIANPEEYLPPPQEGPTPEELERLAELENREREVSIKEREAFAKNLKTFAETLKIMAETDEKGANNSLNTAEVILLINEAKSIGEMINEQNEAARVPGLEGTSGVLLEPPAQGAGGV